MISPRLTFSSFLLAVVLIAVLLVACSDSTTTPEPTATITSGPTNPVSATTGPTSPTTIPQSEAIDKLVNTEMSQQRIPGLALAVVKDGQIIKAQGYGLTNLENQIAVKPESVFESASLGKQFTAAAVMLLVEDGKIKLDAPLTTYWQDAPPAWKDITPRALLTHTSGLPYEVPGLNPRLTYGSDEIYKRAITAPLSAKPGDRYEYSDLGYQLLGRLIKTVAGQSRNDLLQARIFKPLGMATARPLDQSAIVPNRVDGYKLDNGELKRQDYEAYALDNNADGGLYFSGLDLAKWYQALNNRQVLKDSSYAEIWQPVKLNNGQTYPYGFGWAVNPTPNHRLVEHGGGSAGVTHYVSHFVDDKLTVIVLTNLHLSQPWRISRGIAQIFSPALTMTTDVQAAQGQETEAEPQVTALLREFLQQMLNGKIDPNLLTPDLQKQIADIEAAGRDLKSLGAPTAYTLLERKDSKGLRVYRYRVAFGGKSGIVEMTLADGNKIANIEIAP